MLWQSRSILKQSRRSDVESLRSVVSVRVYSWPKFSYRHTPWPVSPVVTIASRRAEKAAGVANRWKIPTVHQTPHQLIEDPNVEIVDIAFPPDQQSELIRHALKQKHVRAILRKNR
jgi:hypothetical protein